MSKFKKNVYFTPAFDKRHVDPNKNYGIHCVDIRFVLKGENGAVQFSLFSGWFLPETEEEYKAKGIDIKNSYPMATDLGYHSYVPMYESQPQIIDKCEHLDGKPCYYDGSSLNAIPILERLLREGDKAVWEKLEEYYITLFKE